MFEIIAILLFGALILVFESVFFVKWGLLVVLLVLVLPGVYGMLGAAPFLATSKKGLLNILKIGRFKKSDVVYELGCGDGRILRAVADKGVKKAVGYEISVPTYLVAKISSLTKRKGEIVQYGNFWKQDFSDADVIICFLLKDTMQEFKRKIWPKLKKGTRVISNSFQINDLDHVEKEGGVYLYVKNN